MEDTAKAAPALRAIVDASLPEGRPRDPTTAPALSLAYIGDTVYDLYVRTLLVERADARVHELHLASAKLVCAAGQASAFHVIEPMLGEDELSVYRRGRNSHMGTVAKNAKISDYRTATGLEALIGFLYLTGRDERLTLLMREIIKAGGNP
jgi:ribonuclease-3 family protein